MRRQTPCAAPRERARLTGIWQRCLHLRAARDALIALAAFSAEIEKIALQVTEPHLGEIRMQWWRDALGDAAQSQKTGHPVADAFADAVRGYALPVRDAQ